MVGELTDLTEPIELARSRDGVVIVEMYEALCRRDDLGWLLFRLSSDSTHNDDKPWYRLTAEWKNGRKDPPQPGPREALVRQIDWVKAFLVGWMAR